LGLGGGGGGGGGGVEDEDEESLVAPLGMFGKTGEGWEEVCEEDCGAAGWGSTVA